MKRRDLNLLLLFSRMALSPEVQPLTGAFWWRSEPIRQEIERIHLWSPAQLCTQFGVALGIRMVDLLNREQELIRLLAIYEREGIQPLTYGQADYPQALAERLGKKSGCAPLVFFTCGECALLSRPALGITGSREPTEEMKRFSRRLAHRCVQENLVLCEGGARGIDQAAEGAQLLAGGCCLCFPAVSIRERMKSRVVRRAVEQGKMLLICGAPPEDPFVNYVALARNHYIAAASRALAAIGPRLEEGGTWRCACDNLKNGWTEPTYVYGGMGRQALVQRGAQPIEQVEQMDWSRLSANT